MPERANKRRCSHSYTTVFENGASSDIFDKLPAELNTTIFGHCESLKDILSLISASPAAHFCFLGNTRACLKQSISEIKSDLISDDLVALALLLLRLRKLRQEAHGRTSLQIQQLIKPTVDAVLHLDPSNPTQEWKGSLAQIIVLRRFLPGIRDFIVSQQERKIPGGITATEEEPAKLTTVQKHSLIDTLLRYDIYCHSFHYGHELLFHGKVLKDKFSPCLDRGLFSYFDAASRTIRRSITILDLIKARHKKLLDLVDEDNWVRTPNSEQIRVREIVNRGGLINIVWRRLRICRYQHRDESQERGYLQHMSQQGYPLLCYMESLDLPSLENHVYATFFEVSETKRQHQQETSRLGRTFMHYSGRTLS